MRMVVAAGLLVVFLDCQFTTNKNEEKQIPSTANEKGAGDEEVASKTNEIVTPAETDTTKDSTKKAEDPRATLPPIKKEKEKACALRDCGPQLKTKRVLCADGKTMAGPTGACKRNALGKCAWEYVKCPPAPIKAECKAKECGPQSRMPNRLCEDGKTVAGPSGKCYRNQKGVCAWEIVQCPPVTVKPVKPIEPIKGCAKGGCSGQLCVEAGKQIMSTCEWREEYACYKKAVCERNNKGKCAWRQTPELKACLSSKASALQ